MQQLTVSLAELPASVGPDASAATMAPFVMCPRCKRDRASSIPHCPRNCSTLAAGIALHLAPAALSKPLISHLQPPWQTFQCLFLFVCWWCCFPDGSSSAGGVILLFFNGFRLSLLLKPACPPAEGAVHGSVTRLWPRSQQCMEGQEELGELLDQVLLSDTQKCWSRRVKPAKEVEAVQSVGMCPFALYSC